MKKFRFSFIGRQSGAIGITYKINDTYHAENVNQALFMLWTDYEHISGLRAWHNSTELKVSGYDLEKCDVSNCYPHRKTNPKTGSYQYTRSDTIVT